MRKLTLVFALLAGISFHTIAQSKSYGEAVNEKEAITMQELSAKMKNDKTMQATVKADITSVCQAEGCWMKVDKGDGTSMMVRMKNHDFTVPKDISGKTAVFTGTASVKTTSVDMLKHYAQDEGKSKEYIESIKEPLTELTFEATGVTIK